MSLVPDLEGWDEDDDLDIAIVLGERI